MFCPETKIFGIKFGPRVKRPKTALFPGPRKFGLELWHIDPCKNGLDDSCRRRKTPDTITGNYKRNTGPQQHYWKWHIHHLEIVIWIHRDQHVINEGRDLRIVLFKKPEDPRSGDIEY